MVKIASIEASAHSRPFEGDVLRNAMRSYVYLTSWRSTIAL